jgi:hypothetical protein
VDDDIRGPMLHKERRGLSQVSQVIIFLVVAKLIQIEI